MFIKRNNKKTKKCGKIKACGLTVCNSSQCLVEGGCITVVGKCDTHASRQEPSGQCEGLLVLK